MKQLCVLVVLVLVLTGCGTSKVVQPTIDSPVPATTFPTQMVSPTVIPTATLEAWPVAIESYIGQAQEAVDLGECKRADFSKAITVEEAQGLSGFASTLWKDANGDDCFWVSTRSYIQTDAAFEQWRMWTPFGAFKEDGNSYTNDFITYDRYCWHSERQGHFGEIDCKAKAFGARGDFFFQVEAINQDWDKARDLRDLYIPAFLKELEKLFPGFQDNAYPH